jgi:hypothetical protein
MNVQQVKAKKAEAEAHIMRILDDFRDQTGLTPFAIDAKIMTLDRLGVRDIEPRVVAVTLRVEV